MFKNFNAREKSLLLMVVILVVVMIVKAFFFDEVRGLSGDEAYVYEFTTYSVEQEYTGFLSQNHIIVYRVFDIYMADPDVTSVLRYEDPRTGEAVERQIEGRYNARVRAYLLGVIPFRSFSVTAQVL